MRFMNKNTIDDLGDLLVLEDPNEVLEVYNSFSGLSKGAVDGFILPVEISPCSGRHRVEARPSRVSLMAAAELGSPTGPGSGGTRLYFQHPRSHHHRMAFLKILIQMAIDWGRDCFVEFVRGRVEDLLLKWRARKRRRKAHLPRSRHRHQD